MSRPFVVCLSPLAWDGLFTSRHAICTELARRGHEVLFVDPPRNIARRRPVGPTRPRPPGLSTMRPPPYLPYGAIGGVSRRLARRVVAGNSWRYASFVAHKVADRRPMLLFNSFMPVLGSATADLLRPDVHVYHRADELRSFPTWRPLYSELEEQVVRQADVVVCVSQGVSDGIRAWRSDAHVIPNGVDPQRFFGAAPHPRLRDVARPVVGLVGTVDWRVDPRFLDAAAGAAGTFVVAGTVERLPLPAGTLALGPLPAEEVPAVLAGLDVGVIPYRADLPVDTLKAYEYLAAGLPVVSSRLACLDKLGSAVQRVDTPEEFHAAVAAAAREDRADRAARGEQGRRTVLDHTWAARTDEILDLVRARW